MRIFHHGKQGIVGIDPKNERVFKTSDRLFHIATHEYRISKALEPVSRFCPWFSRTYGLKLERYNPAFIQAQLAMRLKDDAVKDTDEGDGSGTYEPAEPVLVPVTDKHMLLDTVYMEHVKGSVTLLDMFSSKNVPDYVLVATIRQIVHALAYANTMTGFTHYDLHSENILIRRCAKNLWLLDPHSRSVLPTYSFLPVVIDYGFACTRDTETGPITSSLAFGDYGSTPNVCSDTADMRFLMLGLEYDLKNCRGEFSPLVRKLARINAHLFDRLDIDKNTGWYVRRKATAVRYMERLLTTDLVQKDTACSEILNDNISTVLGMVEICINLPLAKVAAAGTPSPKPFARDCVAAYKRMAAAFKPVDGDCAQNIDGIYIFRVMARAVHEIKFNGSKFSVDRFKNLVFDALRGYMHFYEPRLDWTELYTAILEFCAVFKKIMNIEFTFRLQNAATDRQLLCDRLGCAPSDSFADAFVAYFESVFVDSPPPVPDDSGEAIVSMLGPDWGQIKKAVPVSACVGASYDDTLKACRRARSVQTPVSYEPYPDVDAYCLTDDEDFEWQ